MQSIFCKARDSHEEPHPISRLSKPTAKKKTSLLYSTRYDLMSLLNTSFTNCTALCSMPHLPISPASPGSAASSRHSSTHSSGTAPIGLRAGRKEPQGHICYGNQKALQLLSDGTGLRLPHGTRWAHGHRTTQVGTTEITTSAPIPVV